MQENKKAALQFCINAKHRTVIVHSYDIDFIPLMVYNDIEKYRNGGEYR